MSALASIIAKVLWMTDAVLENFFVAADTGSQGSLAAGIATSNADLCNGFYVVTPNVCGTLLVNNIAQAISALAGLGGPIFGALGTIA